MNLLDPGNQNVDTSQSDYSNVVIDTGNSVADGIFNRNLDRTQGRDRDSVNVPSKNPGEPDRPFNPLSDSSTEAFFSGDETGGVVGTTFPDNPDWQETNERDPREIWQPTPSLEDILSEPSDRTWDASEIWQPTSDSSTIIETHERQERRDASEIWESSMPWLHGLTSSQNVERRQDASDRQDRLNDFVSETADGVGTIITAPVEAVSEQASNRAESIFVRAILFMLMLFFGASLIGGDS